MEDFFETRIDGIDGEIVGLFGVFDGILLYHPSLIPLGTIKSESSFLAGHGGAAAAEYLKRHLFSNLITHPNFISDTKSAIGFFTSPLIFFFFQLNHCLIYKTVASFFF